VVLAFVGLLVNAFYAWVVNHVFFR